MTILFNKLNNTVTLNTTIKATLIFSVATPRVQSSFLSTVNYNNNNNKLDIEFKDWLIFNKPSKVYLNSAESKNFIYSKNCSKSGIFLWYNNINGKYYIGSSINLKHRFYYYFSLVSLKKEKFLNTKSSYVLYS